MAREKRRYRVYRIDTYDVGGACEKTRNYVGETFAVSEKQACNNVRFRDVGRDFCFREWAGDTGRMWTYEAIEQP